MTVLPTLLPIMVDMIERGTVGTVNLTNPGTISHNRILTMYKEMVDPSFTWTNFTEAEQNEVLLSQRSNNFLCTARLESMYPDVPRIEDAVKGCLKLGMRA
jgi:3,5-epimerase/4-reductase